MSESADLGRVNYEAFRASMLSAYPDAANIYLPWDDLSSGCREANRAGAGAVASELFEKLDRDMAEAGLTTAPIGE